LRPLREDPDPERLEDLLSAAAIPYLARPGVFIDRDAFTSEASGGRQYTI
jgi:hypothetical protein